MLLKDIFASHICSLKTKSLLSKKAYFIIYDFIIFYYFITYELFE